MSSVEPAPEGSIFKTKADHDYYLANYKLLKIECPCGGRIIQYPKMKALKERSGRRQCTACKNFRD